MNPVIARLHAIRRLATGAEMDEYDNLLVELVEAPLDPLLLPSLFLCFDDKTEGHEVMWGLLHLVERFPAPHYAPALLGVLPRMVKDARAWAETLLLRMLNSPADLVLLRDAYQAASPSLQQVAQELLQELARRNARFTEPVRQVMAI